MAIIGVGTGDDFIFLSLWHNATGVLKKGLEQNIFPSELHKFESNVCPAKKRVNWNVDILLSNYTY